MVEVVGAVVVVSIGGCGHHNDIPSDGLVDTATSTGDGSGGCGLATCASQNATCGPVGDGCGGVIDCGSCTPPASCGGVRA